MSTLIHILNQFEPISLEQMDAVKLLDRCETKYAFNKAQLQQFLPQLFNDYRILVVESARISRYRSLYFDTGDYALYHSHHNGKLNRYKVRHRTYVESGTGFFELKFKTNKGRTIKKRFAWQDSSSAMGEQASAFLRKHSSLNPEHLKEAIWVNYSRMTLVNKNSPERLTIDTGLEFEWEGKLYQLPELVIAELKQEGKASSPFIDLMKNNGIRKGSLSKYCMAIGLTKQDVKKNRFKPVLNRLNQQLYVN